MKFNIKLVCFLFSTCCLTSCEKNKENLDGVTSSFAIDLNEANKVGYSTLFENTEYVLLKPKNNQYIVSPEKIIKHKDKIYISTRDYNIFIYDLKGEFLNVIDAPGEGPGGIRKIDDSHITENQIIIKDGYLKKYLFYDLNGAFIKEKRDVFPTANFYFGGDFKLLYPHNDPEFGDFRVFKINKDNSVTGVIDLGKYLKPSVYVQDGFQNVPNSDEIFMGLPLTFNILYFNKEGDLTQNIQLDLGENQVSAKERAKFSTMQEEFQFLSSNNYIDSFTRVFPISTKNFMFVVNTGKKYPNIVIGSRDGMVLFNSDAFIDDVNNLQKATIPWTFSEGKVISWNRMKVLYDDYETNSSGNKDAKLQLLFNENPNYLEGEDIVLMLSDIKREFL